MQILGYIGYAILIFFALTWTLGVRVKLEVGLHTIMGALFYMVAAILLGVLGINKLHSWWLLPSGFIFVMLCTFILSARIPLLYSLIKIFGSIYAGIIRIGIPSEKIKAAQHIDAMKTIERVLSNKE
jgi:membrane-associated HD superfamily phosphohydrolase